VVDKNFPRGKQGSLLLRRSFDRHPRCIVIFVLFSKKSKRMIRALASIRLTRSGKFQETRLTIGRDLLTANPGILFLVIEYSSCDDWSSIKISIFE